MPLPSFRNSRSKVRRRRAHHALKPTAAVTCANCAAIILPHRACKQCGFYKGRNVTGASLAKAEKSLAKSVKASKAARASASPAVPIADVTPKKAVAKRVARKSTTQKAARAK